MKQDVLIDIQGQRNKTEGVHARVCLFLQKRRIPEFCKNKWRKDWAKPKEEKWRIGTLTIGKVEGKKLEQANSVNFWGFIWV